MQKNLNVGGDLMKPDEDSEDPFLSINNYADFVRESTALLRKPLAEGSYGVMYLDITGFQTVNDFYGYTEGNRLLMELWTFLKETPSSRVCGRVLSDNFVRLFHIPPAQDMEKATRSYEDRLAGFLKSQQIFHANCNVTIASGFCLVDGADGIVRAIDGANLARKRAKLIRQTKIIWYSAEMQLEVQQRKEMELAVHLALKNEEFTFFLQAKVELNTGKIVGAEALARWIAADEKMIMPDTFIPLLEASGAISQLDFQILRQVCAYLQNKIEHGEAPVRISVNLSREHLHQSHAAAQIHTIAQSYRVPPHLLEFELTETILLDDFSEAKAMMEALHGYGYQTSIDDFGSGFTGFNVWRNLYFDVLKLDKVFIQEEPDFDVHTRSDVLLGGIIDMGHRLNILVLCEGVETLESCKKMRDLGCEIAQGYYFSRPIPPSEFDAFYAQNEGVFDLPWRSEPKPSEDAKAPITVFAALMQSSKQPCAEHFYRDIYDDLPCSVVQHAMSAEDEDSWKLLGVNTETLRMAGCETQEQLQRAKNLVEEDIPKIKKAAASLKKVGDCCTCDFRIRTAAGEIRWLKGESRVVVGPNSELIIISTNMDFTTLKHAQLQLEAEHAKLRDVQDKLATVMKHTPGDVISLRVRENDFDATYLSHGLDKAFGYTSTEFIKMLGKENGIQLVYEKDLPMITQSILRGGRQRKDININFRAKYRDGKLGWHNLHMDFVRTEEDGSALYGGIITSSNTVVRAQEALRSAELRYRTAMDLLAVDAWEYNFETEMLYITINAAVSNLDIGRSVRMTREEFIAREIVHADYVAVFNGMFESMLAGANHAAASIMMRVKGGSYEWFAINSCVVDRKNGKPTESVGMSTNTNDVTLQQKRYRELTKTAMRDALTGLNNRGALEKKVSAKLFDLKTCDGIAAVMMLDIDNFKQVNDVYGHQSGDKLLRILGTVLQADLPENSVIGRLGGDEFFLLVQDRAYESDVYEVADRICKSVLEASQKEMDIACTVTIGIAIVECDLTFDELYRRADKAMYRAKIAGKNKYAVYADKDER